MSAFTKLVECLQTQPDYDQVSELLKASPRESVRGVDHQGLNIVHHALLSKQSDLLRLVLMKGVYQEMEQPEQLPYMPLAAYLGSSSMISTLLEHRPNDVHKKCSLSDLQAATVIRDHSEVRYDDNTPMWALDIAATRKDLKSVQLILNSSAVKLPLKFSLAERCVEAQSLKALSLLLECGLPSKAEISTSFKMALLRKLATYIDELLGYISREDCKTVLNGMNPYHVMYMYSSAFQVIDRQDRYTGITQTSEVLLRREFSACDNVPVGSYPLYSLLYSLATEMDHSVSGVPEHHLDTLDLLLCHGACPNYNEYHLLPTQSEVHSGDILYDITTSTACGRGLYKSAFDALFESLSECRTWKLGSTSCMKQVVTLLLEHGAVVYGTILRDLMQLLALQHYHRNTVDLSSIISIMLKSGAEVGRLSEENTDTVDVEFPTSVYFDCLLSYHPNVIDVEKIKANRVIGQVLNILQFLDSQAFIHARRELCEVFERSLSPEDNGMSVMEGATLSLFAQVKKYLVRLQQPQKLLVLCTLLLWRCIHRNPNAMEQLKLPTNLRHRILSVFDMRL